MCCGVVPILFGWFLSVPSLHVLVFLWKTFLDLFTSCMCIYVEMDKDFLTTAVLPLAIEYTVVVKWRSPADGVAGLGGLTVQALCLSGYSHYPDYGNGTGTRKYYGNGAWTRKYYGSGTGTRKYGEIFLHAQ